MRWIVMTIDAPRSLAITHSYACFRCSVERMDMDTWDVEPLHYVLYAPTAERAEFARALFG
jgi:hypothetical protein